MKVSRWTGDGVVPPLERALDHIVGHAGVWLTTSDEM
jgi:hypothetical protein